MTADAILSHTLPEAARVSGFSLQEITAAVARGDLKARKATATARYRRILHSDLVAWLNSLPEA